MQAYDPWVGSIAFERRSDGRFDELAIGQLSDVLEETCGLRPVRMAEYHGALRELRVVADRQRNHAVRGRIRRVWHDAGMAVAEAPPLLARRQVIRGDVDEHCERRFVKRDFDFLTAASAVARI